MNKTIDVVCHIHRLSVNDLVLPGPFRKFPDIWLEQRKPSLEELLYDIITLTSCLFWLRASQRCSADLGAKIHQCFWKWGGQARESHRTKSHSLLPSVLSLRNIKLTICGQLIRDAALFTSDHRGVKSTRVHFFPRGAIYYHFCRCSFNLWADFVAFRFACKHHKSQ